MNFHCQFRYVDPEKESCSGLFVSSSIPFFAHALMDFNNGQ